MKFFRNIRLLATPTGSTPLKGREMSRVVKIENAAIVTDESGAILHVGPEAELQSRWQDLLKTSGDHVSVDCQGLVALPGFVDSHTHAVFMGERSLEFGMRAEGKSYQEIATAGGGIRSTVDRVRGATANDIAEYSRKYVMRALSLGTTTMEVKSGYGLSTESELALLDAARILSETTPMEIQRTFLGAHAVPRGVEQSVYVDSVINEQLPAVVEQNAAEYCDVFFDEGYFTLEESRRILLAAKARGMKLRLHADELATTGGAELAVELGAYSADHLLKVSDAGIAALASSDRTIATLLPTTALSLRAPFAPARRLIEAGAAVAIASDCNPGSSMSENMQFVITLAVIGMQMSVAEALTGATLNGAAALGISHSHGSLEAGKMADFALYDIPSLEYLPYHVAVSDLVATYKRGELAAGTDLG